MKPWGEAMTPLGRQIEKALWTAEERRRRAERAMQASEGLAKRLQHLLGLYRQLQGGRRNAKKRGKDRGCLGEMSSL